MPATVADDESPETRRLKNLTSWQLSVETDGGRLLVPPLGEVAVEPGHLTPATIRRGETSGVMQLEDTRSPTEISEGLVGLLFAAIVVGGVGALSKGSDKEPTTASTRIVFGAVAVLALLWCVGIVLSLGSFSQMRSALLQVPRRLREMAYFAAVTLIVLAVPSTILYFGSDVPSLIDRASAGDHQAVVALIGIGVQDICIVGASALPVVLYFVFDREKLQTLRTKFARHIFRLDPSISTVRDMEAKYGLFLDEAYGRHSDNRLLPGARSPILLATTVITLGWTIALTDTNVARDPGASTLSSLLVPTQTAPTFAFLGAYFFTLNTVLRGYVRGDLRPKTYAQVTVRTVAVVVLAFVLELLVGRGSSGDPLLVIAFAAGIFPDIVLVRISESLRMLFDTPQARRDTQVLPFAQDEQLTELEGVDIYDRARLLDEGVTSIQALAHHDLVELMLKTRIPAGRLVDWVDQAVLYIHCSSARPTAEQPIIGCLRQFGIRTATDLESAHKAAHRRGQETEFLAIVPLAGEEEPAALRVILDAIADDEWMDCLRCWRREPKTPPLLCVPEDLDTWCLRGHANGQLRSTRDGHHETGGELSRSSAPAG